MRRGEIWTVAGASDYAGKPRPSVVVQDDAFSASDSVTVCGFTSDLTAASLLRIRVEPTVANGLFQTCDLMVDKVTTVQRGKLGRKIGTLEFGAIEQFNAAILIFLGIASANPSEGS